MSSNARLWIRLPLFIALAAALLVSLSAGADRARAEGSDESSAASTVATAPVGVQATDDDIPGVALPASPVAGTLRYYSDHNDVFAVSMRAGETLSARVIGSAGNDLDLYLYKPGATALYADADMIVAAAEVEDIYPDSLYDAGGRQFVAPEEGTYYLDVAVLDAPRDDSPQAYTLEWAKGTNLPSVTAVPASRLVGYRGTVGFAGSVLGSGATPMGGARVELWAWPYPYRTFVRRASSVVEANGTYRVSTTADRTARYRVIVVPNVADHAFGQSAVTLVKAKAWLSAPRVKAGTKYHGKPFTAFGYLKPLHPSGASHVKITAYRGDAGVWKVAKNYYYSSTTTRYAVKITLPYRGTWKLVASTPDDGEHAATTSSATYVRIR